MKSLPFGEHKISLFPPFVDTRLTGLKNNEKKLAAKYHKNRNPATQDKATALKARIAKEEAARAVPPPPTQQQSAAPQQQAGAQPPPLPQQAGTPPNLPQTASVVGGVKVQEVLWISDGIPLVDYDCDGNLTELWDEKKIMKPIMSRDFPALKVRIDQLTAGEGLRVVWGETADRSLLQRATGILQEDKYASLDAVLMFYLAACPDPDAPKWLARVLALSEPSAIEVVIENLTHFRPFLSGEQLSQVVDEMTDIMSQVDVRFLGYPARTNSLRDWPPWLETGSLIRKTGLLVKTQLLHNNAADSDSFSQSMLAMIDGQKKGPPKNIVDERKEAMTAGIVIAASLSAAAKMTATDEARKQAIKDCINTVVGAGLGAGMTPGAVIAPVANFAISSAVEYAVNVRDFTSAANMLRGSLESFKLNEADIASATATTPATSGFNAARYFHWINTAVHCMGVA